MVEGITIRRLEDPKAPVLDEVAVVVADALFDGTVGQVGCAGDKALFRKFQRALAAGTAHSGHLYAAFDDRTGAVVGSIAFFQPGKTIIGDDEQRAQGFNAFVATLPQELLPWWTELAPRVLAELDKLVGEGGKERSWSAHSFAVREDYRGRGVGKALLGTGEALAKADKMPVIFETEHLHNVHMYKHLGYNIVQVIKLDGLGDREYTLFRKDVFT
ncbi:GNAT family N-acetyltransferase [Phanerochaete sordida]|uniref:GNAT family N-acetyltransferase n=1 Tax=Phanerochaete sordida TaxID=48140 RepID=A0A9P3GLQ0_9APHY|nr:GNAT family N-acetyltransferase [Phanerochaete sordida]